MPQLLIAALVTIRIFNYAALPPGQIDAARVEAERIFQETGIALQWTECRVPGAGAGAACNGPLGESEFVLRLLEGPASDARRSARLPLGSSLLDVEARGGVLITIDPRRVAAIAGQADADPSVLLGRAMAHELGHMLLGTPGHARAGIMRALWSQAELQGNHPADWHFSPREIGAMRHGLAVRTQAGN